MAILVPRVWTKFFSMRQLLMIIYGWLIIGYLIASIMTSEVSYITVFLLTTIVSWPYQVIYNQHIMSQAQPHEVGELSGTLGSVSNIAMIIGPLIGGTLLQYHINIHRWSIIFIIAAIWMMRHYLSISRW
jgi:MFS family permease